MTFSFYEKNTVTKSVTCQLYNFNVSVRILEKPQSGSADFKSVRIIL